MISKCTAPLALLLAALLMHAQDAGPTAKATLWSLRPVARPIVDAAGQNPIDVLMARKHAQKGLRVAGRADKATLLRRVYLDLTGLPPAPEDVDAFLRDTAPDAYAKVVERLLADPQHGVRYGRHWLDVLGYADVDEGMLAESGIFHWRDWVIRALNRDLPYDQFVRAHVAGDLSPRADDFFATGFLTRAVHSPGDPGEEMAFAAVEKISTAFMGVTTGCAKCHDHMYDPILQRDYYAMKALFDPLVPEKKNLATAEELARHEDVLARWRAEQNVIQARMDVLTKPYEKQIFEERMTFLPKDVEAVFRKEAKLRTPEEREIVKRYETVVTPDARKFRDVMKPSETVLYEWTRKGQTELRRDAPSLPVFWTVRTDAARAARKNNIYLGGDKDKKGDEVQPGFPFAPKDLKFEGDRRQVFLNWLTAKENPLFARVAVNRLWQWHFGEGIVGSPSDFGRTGQMPINPELLDYLASEFAERGYSMKAMHRLMVTSEAYQRAGVVTKELRAANEAIDPGNKQLWKFPVRRLEAEAIRDSVLAVSGKLDTSVGGMSFRGPDINERRVMSATKTGYYDKRDNRRGIYMGRGSDASMNMMPAFLATFDAEDGHTPCARRERSITAPQVLYLLNGELTQLASRDLAERLYGEAAKSPAAMVDYGYKLVLGRTPSATERDAALSYIGKGEPAQLTGFAWMLLNLSEFVFLP
jgi:hypothetical protein